MTNPTHPIWPSPQQSVAPVGKPLTASFRLVAVATQLALVGIIGLACYLLMLSVEGLGLVTALETGVGRLSEANDLDRRIGTAAIAHDVLYLAISILFISWTYTLRRCDRVAPEAMRHRPGWAIGGWLVPVMNVFRPFQVMSDLWRGLARPPVPHEALTQPPVPRLVPVWWGAFVGLSVMERALLAGTWIRPETLDAARELFQTEILVSAMMIAAAGLAIAVVQRYTSRALRTPPLGVGWAGPGSWAPPQQRDGQPHLGAPAMQQLWATTTPPPTPSPIPGSHDITGRP